MTNPSIATPDKEFEAAIVNTVAEKTWQRHPDQMHRRNQLLVGETILINTATDRILIEWAKANNLYVSIKRPHWRQSEEDQALCIWGNPFILGKHGDRDACCDQHAQWIYAHKELASPYALATLKGKALGCVCYPARCHGHTLIQMVNEVTE